MVKEVKSKQTEKRWPRKGYRYGFLVVASRGRDDKYRHARYWCRCDCGKRKLIRGDILHDGKVVSCGHIREGKIVTETVQRPKCIDTGEIFVSMRDANTYAGLPATAKRIAKCCDGLAESAGEHPDTGNPLHWEWASVEVEKKLVHPVKTAVNRSRRKNVVLLNTGETFSSLDRANKKYPCADQGAISRVCNGKRASAGKDPLTGDPLVWMWWRDYKEILKKSGETIE